MRKAKQEGLAVGNTSSPSVSPLFPWSLANHYERVTVSAVRVFLLPHVI